MKETMKALVLYGPEDMRLEERPVPHADADSVVVQVDYSEVCGSDISFYHGHYPPVFKLPFIPGHGHVGTVVEVGDGVEGYAVGDRLICSAPNPCKEMCSSCAQGKPNACLHSFPKRALGFSYLDGSYAEYMRIPDISHMQPLHIPDGLDSQQAVLYSAVGVSLHSLRLSRFKVGDSCVVSGSGAVGLPLIQLLKVAGARAVIALDVFDESEANAKLYGADHFINTTKCDNLEKAVQDLLGAAGADIVFESSGVPESFMNCIKCAIPCGQVVVAGSIGTPVTFIPSYQQPKELDYQWSFVYTRKEVETYLDLLNTGKLQLPGMVTGVFSLDEAVEKFIGLPNRKGHIKGLINPRL